MVNHDQFCEVLIELEDTLVEQFRQIQQLIELTLSERQALLENSDSLMNIVEEKEVLLDRLGLLEDNRRKAVQKLALERGIVSDETSIAELLPYLDESEARRVTRLAEGITSLAREARQLNDYNQALAVTRLDWLQAAQVFLVGVVQPEPAYAPPYKARPAAEAANFGMDYRA
uniref:Flagellar protein FlgN n=1 Tax=Bellilinea caldifistulae TaxID=360411 RepID=A0A7C4Q2E2_9CHLR